MRYLINLILLVISVASVLAQSPETTLTGENRRILERIIVKVNGEILTQTELEKRQVSAISEQGQQPTTNAELAELLIEVTPILIANAVDEMLLAQRGRMLGLELDDSRFREFLDNLKQENNIESDEELTEILDQQEGITLQDLRRLVETQMLVGQVRQEILNRVSITELEAQNYYDDNIDEFTQQATVTLREILIAVPVQNPALGVGLMADQRARAEATTAIERLQNGEDFLLVAAEISDSAAQINEGLIGPLQLSEISESVKEKINSLRVGDFTELIRNSLGYQILKLEAQTDDIIQPFEEVREMISNSVFNDRRSEEYETYLTDLRDTAIIEWRNEELQEAYDLFRANRPVVTPTPR
jgi:foldase protein PrsA